MRVKTLKNHDAPLRQTMKHIKGLLFGKDSLDRLATEEDSADFQHLGIEDILPSKDWTKFLLGNDEKGKPLVWDPYESAHLYSFGQHATMITANIVQHCAYNPDKWITFVVDPQETNVPRTGEMMVDNVEFLTDVDETLAAADYLYNEVILRTQTALKPHMDTILQHPHPYKSLLLVLAEPARILKPTGIATEEGIAQDAMREKIKNRLFNIAHFGQKSGIHLMIAGDFVKSKDFYSQILENIETRVLIGSEKQAISEEVFGHPYWERFDSSIRGRGYFQSKNKKTVFQASEYAVRTV